VNIRLLSSTFAEMAAPRDARASLAVAREQHSQALEAVSKLQGEVQSLEEACETITAALSVSVCATLSFALAASGRQMRVYSALQPGRPLSCSIANRVL